MYKHPSLIANPANAPVQGEAATDFDVRARTRIPMSVPRQKLQTSDIIGYHQHWFLESRVPMATQAGYEFVSNGEVTINQLNVGNASHVTGNVDLGSRVRVVAGVGEGGVVEYHVLMKIKEEWWQEDQDALAQRNAGVMAAIFLNETVLGAEKVSAQDKSLSYVNRGLTKIETPSIVQPGAKPLFMRPTRKSAK